MGVAIKTLRPGGVMRGVMSVVHAKQKVLQGVYIYEVVSIMLPVGESADLSLPIIFGPWVFG